MARIEETTNGWPPAAAEAMLADLRAVTDAALAHLEVEDLLDELLDRVREIVKVDTATVLLLRQGSQQLVAAASKGIEEEVRQDVHIPVGKGFAGRVAAVRSPVIIEHVDSSNVVSPLLIEREIRSLLGVPLVASGALVGVLHVGTLTPRRFTDSDVELVQLAADRAAIAVQSLLSHSERTAARELQRSLLPPSLPAIPGVEMAAHYSPGAANVGGDWYDVFTLPSGELGLVMGDVAGHGLGAATVMGRMRSALRAYALESRHPAEVLSRLDRKMQHFEPEATASVLYAVCHPRLHWAQISSAGHCPPVVAFPNGPATVLDINPDVLIGADEPSRPRHATTVDIPPGALMCLYTDGLIERRNQPVDNGLAKLSKSIYPGQPESVCATVMSKFIGQEPLQDDIALLILRRLPTNSEPVRTV